MVSRAQEQVLAALHDRAAGDAPWWDDALCRPVTFAGWRPTGAGQDAWGVQWSALEGETLYVDEHPARCAAELLDRHLPDGRDPAPFAGLLDRAGAHLPDPGPRPVLTIGVHPLGPLDRLATLLGAERALPALLEEPDACRTLLDRIVTYHVNIAENYLAAGVGAGWLADDYAGTAGPLLSPALWRELFLPGLTRIIRTYRRAGALCFFHTCGQAGDLLPDLLAAGVTAFNLESGVQPRYPPGLAFIGCPAWLAGW